MSDWPSRRGPLWRAKITGFGRVRDADIEMAPLVLLVGRNNTGKSYVASLIWAIFNFEDTFLGLKEGGDLIPEWFKALTTGEYDEDNSEIIVTPQMLNAWIERVLAERLSGAVQRVLSYSPAAIGHLEIESTNLHQNCVFRRTPLSSDETHTAEWGLGERDDELAVEFGIASGEDSPALTRGIFSVLLAVMLEGREQAFSSSNAIYIPAARTGLMLALGPITASALETLGIEEPEERTRLPLPTIRFLQALTRNRRISSGANHEDVASFLEQEVLRGRIVRDSTTTPSFSYETDDAISLPLHMASSMVTELAPFLVLLRSARFERGLIFEEPEAHLHLAAQRAIARAIARLVNSGVPVVVTTHSDTFLQELNLLMQLSVHPEREKIMAERGYIEADLVNPDHVKGYEFVDEGGCTIVHATEKTQFGIVVPSLNEVLADLSEELLAVQE